MTISRTRIVPALTGLRAALAGMIFFYHWFFQYVESLPLLIRAPFRAGYVGVPVFLALSGFLIAVRYYPALEKGNFAFAPYLIKRLTRIYPLYLVVLTLFVVALGRPENMMPHGFKAFMAVYTLTQAWFPSLLHIGTTVGWTLTVQMVFYLFAPPMVKWLGRPRAFAALIGRALLLGAGAAALGLLIARLPLAGLLPDTLIGAPDTYILHYSPFGHLGDFVVGMAAGLALLRPNVTAWLKRHFNAVIWAGTAGAWGCVITLDVVPTELGSPLNRLLAFGVALFASAVIAALAGDVKRANPLTRLLSARPIVYLGAISYALFVIQLTEPCQWMYWIFLGEMGGVENRIWRAILLYGIATVMAIILHESVEKPAHRLARRIGGRA